MTIKELKEVLEKHFNEDEIIEEMNIFEDYNTKEPTLKIYTEIKKFNFVLKKGETNE